jgi:hypothetical protein
MIAITPLALAAAAACGGSSKSAICFENLQHQRVCGAAAAAMCREIDPKLRGLLAQGVPIPELNRVGRDCLTVGVHVLGGPR